MSGAMMKRLWLRTVLTGLALLLCAPAPAEAPRNLYLLKQELRAYVNTGQYKRDIAAVSLRASKYLQKRLRKKDARKLALVLDIDETALSNLPYFLANDFGYVPERWDAWIEQARAPALIPVQVVYDIAVQNKVAVFFISARKEAQRAATEHNLRDVGYETWTKAYFKADDDDRGEREFKIMTRRQIAAEGYQIIANIGDQDSDLAGGFAERAYRLPCPFYLTP